MTLDDKIAYFNSTNRLDKTKFDSPEEIGRLIDMHNNTKKEKALKRTDEDITEISKFLAKVMLKNSTTIILGNGLRKDTTKRQGGIILPS